MATIDDAAAVARSLASAFDDDPVFAFMIPDDARRATRLPRFFEVFLRAGVRRGETVYTDEGAWAAALWAPPGNWETRLRDIARIAVPMARILGRRLPASLAGLSMVEQVHPHDPPHWYLASLGTHCDHQGKGLGSAVLAPVLDHCDREGLPAYLESSKEANIPFYERHGFRVTSEIRFGKKGPFVYPMWRDPQPDG